MSSLSSLLPSPDENDVVANRMLTVNLDLFALHLAMELFGNATILDHLQQRHALITTEEQNHDVTASAPETTTSSRPLYWRSKVAFQHHDNDDPPSLLSTMLLSTMSSNTTLMETLVQACPPPQVLFVDILFDFVKKEPSRHNQSSKGDKNSFGAPTSVTDNSTETTTSITASFGCMFVNAQNNNNVSITTITDNNNNNRHHHVTYLAAKPITKQQLYSHVISLQLDPQTVTSKSLAMAMAHALLQHQSSSQRQPNNHHPFITFFVKHHNNHLVVPYTALSATGILDLTRDESRSTTFDGPSMRFLLWDLLSRDNHCKNENNNDLVAVAQQRIGNNHPAKKENNKSTTTATTTTATISDQQVFQQLEVWKRKRHHFPKIMESFSSKIPSPTHNDDNETSNMATSSSNDKKQAVLAKKRKLASLGAGGTYNKNKANSKKLVFDNDDSTSSSSGSSSDTDD
ncbi:hypothetical protein IV203_023146 [Nitzschia inconspicua]|uniref:Uncharacterized protein n=1 Tax=Nitzschia inconspicua TaxID=303405 RepID=A0A9K3KCQ2_9STRA|nr:hypothetical protein IV203_023146 [Nitzschia inconspicua]